jgi:hypothetical protein
LHLTSAPAKPLIGQDSAIGAKILADRVKSRAERIRFSRTEFSLTALVYNLRRALNILGMEKLMAAVAA